MKLYFWLKSYGDFAEFVGFAFGGVASGRECACSLCSRLAIFYGDRRICVEKSKDNLEIVIRILCERAIYFE